ncbi:MULTISPECIES: fimbrial protein [Enterobacterales]|uniref:fimbrial protein n=1 Tax=Enterobacterales TaxID=91347 RepID=UPI002ED808DC
MRKGQLNIYISGLCLGLLSFGAKAASNCTVLDGKSYRVLTASIPLDPDAPDGSVLYRRYVDTSGPKIACLSGSAQYKSEMTNKTVTGVNADGNIFETGIPGVGIQISDLMMSNRKVPNKGALSPNDLLPAWSTSGRIRVDFIKTGPISQGYIRGGKVAEYKVDDYTVASIEVKGNQSWVIKSCTIDSADRNKTVQLGNYRASDFSSVGSTTVDKYFSLTLNCQQDSTPVYLSFEPTTGSSGDGILTLDKSGTDSASGIAIEILNKSDRTPLVFNNAIKYHSGSEKKIEISYIAHYKKINSTVSPGTANAAMTFTIDQY